MGARYYAPNLGRWISEDAYRGEISDPLSLNLYVFCINNPLIYVDPSGYSPKLLPVIAWLGKKLAPVIAPVTTGVHKYGTKAYDWTVKQTHAVGEKVQSWFGKKAGSCVIPEVAELKSKKINHILADKHAWGKVVQDPQSWEQISKVISKVMEKGTVQTYKSVFKKTMEIGTEIVEVTYKKTSDGSIKISNAWVKTQ